MSIDSKSPQAGKGIPEEYGTSSSYPKEHRDSISPELLSLVRRTALHLKGRLPKNVEVDDLMQSGLEGLVQAMKAFDIARNISLEQLLTQVISSHDISPAPKLSQSKTFPETKLVDFRKGEIVFREPASQELMTIDSSEKRLLTLFRKMDIDLQKLCVNNIQETVNADSPALTLRSLTVRDITIFSASSDISPVAGALKTIIASLLISPDITVKSFGISQTYIRVSSSKPSGS